MSEGGKRSLRERRVPKNFDSDVSLVLARTKILTLMDTDDIPTPRYTLTHLGYEIGSSANQLRGQTFHEIY